MNTNVSLDQHYAKADKMMLYIIYFLVAYAFGLAFWFDTWASAIIVGGGTAVAATLIFNLSKGSLLCRIMMSSAFMVLTALHIHQAHGMIEMHFGVFALLAILLYYRDAIPILVAAAVIAVHHLSFYFLQANGSSVWIFRDLQGGINIVFLHAAYVVVESAVLVWFSLNLKQEANESLEIMDVTNNIIKDQKIDLRMRTSNTTPLLKRFDSYTEDIEKLAQQVSSSALRLQQEGTDLATVTDIMQQASARQQKETDLIGSAMEQMSVATKEVSANATEAAGATDEVNRSANEAAKVSTSTQHAVEALAQQVSQAVSTIKQLNEQTNNIGSVLDVIKGVAEQTNLLALNAAIEAARAGDQGRGFAVVADEVRTLAQRTQQSTEEINQMIEALQTGSHSAVNVIEKSRSQAEECVENTKSTLALMQKVSDSINRINQMNTLIANSSKEQNTVIDSLSENLNNILDATNKSTDDSARAASNARSLQKIATELTTLSSKFITH